MTFRLLFSHVSLLVFGFSPRFYIFSLVYGVNPQGIEKKYSVTIFEDLKDFFLQMREQVIEAEPQPKSQTLMDTEEMKRICRKIFSRYEYYTIFKEVSKSTNERCTRNFLMHERKDIFDNFFEIVPDNKSIRQITLRHVNRPTPRHILVHGKGYPEITFGCLVAYARFELDEFDQYFISINEYNMNEAPGEESIGGRFIFHNHEITEGSYKVVALAEEYAHTSVKISDGLSSYYISRRQIHSPVNDPKDDPVCKLDMSRRFRLCNSIMIEEPNWRQGDLIVGDKCERNQFTFPDETLAPSDEWMMTCTKIIHGQPNKVFYVSRSYKNNEVFLFETYEEKLVISRASRRIGVVKDNGNPVNTGK